MMCRGIGIGVLTVFLRTVRLGFQDLVAAPDAVFVDGVGDRFWGVFGDSHAGGWGGASFEAQEADPQAGEQ